jgi:hypothetical protein
MAVHDSFWYITVAAPHPWQEGVTNINIRHNSFSGESNNNNTTQDHILCGKKVLAT